MSKYYLYDKYGVYCPFCSDETVSIMPDVKFGKYESNEYYKLYHECCGFRIEIKLPDNLLQEYKEYCYIGYLSRNGVDGSKYFAEIEKRFERVLLKKIIMVYKTMIPISNAYMDLSSKKIYRYDSKIKKIKNFKQKKVTV